MVHEHPRITPEKKPLRQAHIYCTSNHETHAELCPECAKLFEYAKTRLDKCSFQEKKSTCG
jgi:hypothetical protein